MKENPRVSIIILNWNNWEDTIECLESVFQITYPSYDVIVVDNGSVNDSVKRIRDYCNGVIKIDSEFLEYDCSNKPVTIIEYTRLQAENSGVKELALNSLKRKIFLIINEKNFGFTEGNNIGMRYGIKFLNPDYLLLLNNDTIVEKKFLNELINVANTDDKIGFVGPKIYYYDLNGRRDVIQSVGGNQNIWIFDPILIGYNEIDRGQYNSNKQVEFLHGSCLLVKSEMINDIGLLDNDFFSYREENDWAFRGSKQGWKSVYVYNSIIWHKGGRSTSKVIPLVIYYMTKNRFLFMKKNASILQILSFMLFFFLFQFWFKAASSLIYQKSSENFFSFLKGVIDGLKYFTSNK